MIKTKFFVLFLFCSSFIFGQSAIGFKFGGHLGQFSGFEVFEFGGNNTQEYNFGFQIGLIYEIAINDQISIQPELLYLQKGYKIKFEFMDSFSSEQEVTINYLELPILAKMKFGDTESLNFFAIVGPSFGYALSGDGKFTEITNGETTTDTEEIEFSENDEFERLDVSAAIGGGMSIPINLFNLFFEGRYLLGVSNLNDDEFDQTSINNRGISFVAGIMIPLKKRDNSVDK